MGFKKLTLLAVVLILTVCGALLFFRDYVVGTKNAQMEITDLSSLYEAQEEIAAAAKELQKGVEPVEIVTKDANPQVAIIHS